MRVCRMRFPASRLLHPSTAPTFAPWYERNQQAFDLTGIGAAACTDPNSADLFVLSAGSIGEQIGNPIWGCQWGFHCRPICRRSLGDDMICWLEQ